MLAVDLDGNKLETKAVEAQFKYPTEGHQNGKIKGVIGQLNIEKEVEEERIHLITYKTGAAVRGTTNT